VSEQAQIKPRARAKATAWKSEYLRTYRREHRKAERLSPEELERCRQNPALLREIRGPQWIACPMCGLLFQKLPEHLASEHAAELMPDAELVLSRPPGLAESFKRKFGLPQNYPLCSHARSEMQAAKIKASGYLPAVETRFGQPRGPSPQQGVKARREWGISPTERRARRELMLTPKSRQQHAKWWAKTGQPKLSSREMCDIADRRLRGHSQERIAEHHKVTQGAVSWHLRRMGFPHGREFVL
jgi:hypothetical protein